MVAHLSKSKGQTADTVIGAKPGWLRAGLSIVNRYVSDETM
jgi:hypothetical protein